MKMKTIDVSAFLDQVDVISAMQPDYRHGGSGDDGTCDCIGLVIGAIRRGGGAWPGMHGSNYAARNEMISLTEINEARDLSVGELVFKHYRPGERGYDLPERYRGGLDWNDYYHVGVVISVAPLKIRHMSSPGIRTDT